MKPHLCKAHGFAHPYTECPECQHEFCAKAWTACPRCAEIAAKRWAPKAPRPTKYQHPI